MKVSAFTVITNPGKRYYPWIPSIQSALNFADEVVIVDGSSPELHAYHEEIFPQVKWVREIWPDEWNWDQWPIKFNKGLQACTGDWAIRFDVDYVFPHNWKKDIKPALERIGNQRTARFQKLSAFTAKKWYTKGVFQYGFNRKYKDTMYGSGESKTDLLVPIVMEVDGPVPKGRLVHDSEMGNTALKFFNYDHVFQTKEAVENHFYEYSKAYKRYFGETPWGETPEESLKKFIEMMKKRKDEVQLVTIPFDVQPAVMKDTLSILKPEQWGHNGWGLV